MHSIDNRPDRRTLQDRRTSRWSLADDLLSAIERDEIEVLYQPLFRTADDMLIGAEALARWNHPRAGMLGGSTLFTVAERAGHVVRLSRQIARTALSAAALWPAPLRLSLNVTAADLAAADFPDAVAALTAVTGFPPDRLTLDQAAALSRFSALRTIALRPLVSWSRPFRRLCGSPQARLMTSFMSGRSLAVPCSRST